MEFKLIKDQINELEYQETNDLLTSKGLTYLKELKLILKQREEMLEMLIEVKNRLKGNGFPRLQNEIEQLIKEATEL